MTRSVLGASRVPVLALALGLAISVLPAQPSTAAVQKVTPKFFGMTDVNPETWPQAKVGAMRLWDSGVAWKQIETRPGVFDFTRLDAQVNAARANGARPLLVLGMTPKFHATRPGQTGYYGAGSVSMPALKPWRRYVAKVVRRYAGRMDYQVWNEANVSGFWQGTAAQMATLTKVTSKVVARNDARAKVVGPALATRLTGQRKWLRTFYAQRTGGSPVARWIDIVSLNLYPLPKDGPETSMTLLSASRTMLRAAGVRKPIWNTEINYGLQTGGGGVARDISRAKEASFVARTYILNAAGNVKRVFWYSWQLQNLANTQLTFSDGATLTRAGVAYKVVQEWLSPGRMQGCRRDSRGTYTCTVTYADGVKRIYWNPSRRATIRAVGSATRKVGLRGFSEKLKGGERLRVNHSPIMVRSGR